MRPDEYLQYLKELLGDRAVQAWQPENTYGLFQAFRLTPERMPQVFAPIASGAAYVTRLQRVYEATAGPDESEDGYFVVRTPIHRSEQEVTGLGQEFVRRLRILAEVIGDPELTGILRLTSRTSVLVDSDLDFNASQHLVVYEAVGDWLASSTDRADPVSVLNEAYYSIACDYWIAAYLRWPCFARFCGADVFEPYFELWRSGKRCAFSESTLLIS